MVVNLNLLIGPLNRSAKIPDVLNDLVNVNKRNRLKANASANTQNHSVG